MLFLLGCGIDNSKVKIAESNFKGYKKVFSPEQIQEKLQDRNNARIIKVPDNGKHSTIHVDNIIDSLSYIRLETNKNAPIEGVDKISFIDDKIVLFDKQKKRGLYLFSKDGKFLCKIGNVGKGPEDYVSVCDVAINRQNNNIVVLDEYGKNLLYFDTNGKFIKRNKVYYFTKDFSILPDGSFVFYQLAGVNSHLNGIDDYCLLFSKEDQVITNYAFPYSYRKKYSNLSFGRVMDLKSCGSSTLFNPFLTNEIYEINGIKEKNILKYKLDLSKDDILTKINDKTNNDDYLRLINNSEYNYFDGQFLDNEQTLYFKFGNGKYCFYNIKSGNLEYGSSFNYESIKEGEPFLPFVAPIAVNGNYFVSVLWPFEISQEQKKIINSSGNLIFKDLKNLTDLDNPILIFFKVKEF